MKLATHALGLPQVCARSTPGSAPEMRKQRHQPSWRTVGHPLPEQGLGPRVFVSLSAVHPGQSREPKTQQVRDNGQAESNDEDIRERTTMRTRLAGAEHFI